jgi:AraC-like DNA-binding protein/mannose-6-phosphate isomerase-like protein (cupin superfamily)
MSALLQSRVVGVAASTARDEAVPVAMRAGSPVRAGAWPQDGDDLVAIWHTHELHQLLYAFEGVAEVETAGSRHLLPPQQAAWIPAGLPHQTTLRKVRTVAVFFEPTMVPGHDDRVRVLSAGAPVREMILYAARWRIDRPVSDPTADAFFTALALLTAEWLDTAEAPLRLPTSTVPVVAAVMQHTQAHLADVDERSVCRAVGISERSLRRTFRAETGTSWREYRTTSRILRAMTMLVEHDRSILDTAVAVGFRSLSGFDRAFRRLTGEPPVEYRRRIRDAAMRDAPDVEPNVR